LDTDLERRIKVGMGELLLILIVILNILDVFEVLPGDLDYVKKILSWTILGYLLYRASLTDIFFSQRKKDIDLLLVIAYFLFIIKDFVSYSLVAWESSSTFMIAFYDFVIRNTFLFEKFAFMMGLVMLILLSFYSAVKLKIKKPSLMHILQEEGPPARNIYKIFERSVIILLVFLTFFIVVFNLIMEWLAIAIDAPIILIGLLFYIIFFIKHSRKFRPESFLYKLGNMGNKFYTKFIDHFKYKKTMLLGISGLLVLHLLTDLGNFILPYVWGLKDKLYFPLLGEGHTALWPLLKTDLYMYAGSIIKSFELVMIYLFNVIAIIFLLVTPIIIWYLIHNDKKIRIKRWWLALFFTSYTTFLLAPIFIIKALNAKNLIGVDIMTQSVLAAGKPVEPIFLLSVVIGLAVLLLSKMKIIEEILIIIWLIISQVFFGMYVYYFFIDVTGYFKYAVIQLALAGNFVFAAVFLVFMTMTALFYVGGFLIFIYEIIKKLKKHVSFS
jgi:hypothetical protein